MNTSFSFQEFDSQDFDSLLKMSLKLWTKVAESDLRNLLKQVHVRKHQKILISKNSEKENIGFAIFSIRTDYVEGSKNTPTGYLEGIFVEPDFRKHGIAKRLVELGEAWLKENACTQIGSDTWLTATASRDFHKKMGFREEEELVHFLKDI